MKIDTNKVLLFLGSGFIIWIGGWTFSQNITFIFYQGLFINFILALLVWLVLLFFYFILPGPKLNNHYHDTSSLKWSKRHSNLFVISILGFVISVIMQNLFAYWFTAIITIGGLLFIEIKYKSSPQNEPPSEENGDSLKKTLILLAIILGVAVFAYFANRADVDDGYYLSMAARSAEAPFAPYTRDYPSLPPGTIKNTYSMYEVMGYLQFIGLVSWFTNSHPLVTISYFFSILGAVYIVIAYALLYRKLFSKYWLITLFFTVAILLIDGTDHRGPGNFSFVRIWQGKAMIYHILRPLILYFSFSFGEKPSFREFFMLFLANIGGLGLSPISIWVSPVLITGGVISGMLSARGFKLRTLVFSSLSFIYPFIVALLSFQDELEKYEIYTFKINYWLDGLQRSYVQPDSGYFWWYAGFLLLFLFIAPNRRSRFIGLLTGFIFFAIFMNPILAPTISHYVTNTGLYWRTLFLILVVPSTAWVLAFPAYKLSGTINGHFYNFLKINTIEKYWKKYTHMIISSALSIIMLVSFALIVPTIYIFQFENRGIWFGSPGINVQKDEYEILFDLSTRLKPDSVILAPHRLSWMFPTLIGRIWSVAPRPGELNLLAYNPDIDPDETELRIYMYEYINGISEFELEKFNLGITRFNVNVVILSNNYLFKDPYLRKYLRLSKFQVIENEGDKYIVWLRE